MSSLDRSKLKRKDERHAKLKSQQKSRKQLRKELRKQKKINKTIYFQTICKLRTARTRTVEHEAAAATNETENDSNVVADEDVSVRKKTVKIKERQELQSKKINQKTELLKNANLKEDKIIKKLEKQLKLNKRKKKTVPKSFVADGLDYLLNFCLEKDRKCMVETERELLENEFNDELKADLTVTIAEDPAKNSFIDKPCQVNRLDRTSIEENIKDSRLSGIGNETANNDSLRVRRTKRSKPDVERDSGITPENRNDGEDLWEDIYGRKRDKDGNVVRETNKYVPPAARSTTDDERLCSLRKRLKGCLNRVAEHNIHNIANQIEEMYMTNTRNNMNRVLSDLVFEGLILNVLTPDRLICEHMMLIAILHANVGIEIGAHFLEKLARKLVDMMERPQDVENKRLDNMVLMISHLYNFKVYGHKLLYQILDRLVVKFSEKEIELILLILRTVGFSLRKDDPIALKRFIENLQEKASSENGKSSRIQFMLDILLAIKNNNVSKIPQYDPSHVEHLRKIIRTVIRKGNTITQFNVSLEDLLRADENGKWWIVGSAWSGFDEVHDQRKTKQKNVHFSEKILELAQKQRMNTDTRRNIFCILMTAEDYFDAFEKLNHLGLRDRQTEEIIHVLMHCCLQENKFNPYYAVLAQKLCEYDRKYQLTIQYNLWDKLKMLESYKSKQLENLAQFLTYLFIERCLALSILKVIQFTELDKHTVKFLKQIMLGILSHKNEQACLQVFKKISISPQLQSFRESLRLFINYFLIKNNTDSSSVLDEQEVILKKRIESVERILISHESKGIF
ncbi:nucleolar MIF4G domain-containing protein 1 isoform X1 [Calliopsis andreniformis]|uniref:nucleolar MIF4G domain-containing protein 1 isoform X1 n=1 Tax=Calliopsis andreniformis TaxID=337506 RepID=UPI003FCD6913